MTDAFEKWLETQPVVHDVEQLRAAWDAALEWARGQQKPVVWRMRNSGFRRLTYEYFNTKDDALQRELDFNRPCDDAGLCDLTPLYTNPAPALNTWGADKGYTLDYSIHSNPSASVWAEAFCKQFPNSGADEGLMTGWFANAMMAMHDHLKRQEPDVSELVEAYRKCLYGFMLDCNSIGAQEAGVNLVRTIKDVLAKWEAK